VNQIKIYIYFGLKIFLLVMGWIIFYRLKLMKYYTDSIDPTNQADSIYDCVVFSISILLIITFLVISILSWHEYLRMNTKNKIFPDYKFSSASSESHSEKSFDVTETQNLEKSEKAHFDLNKSRLLDCFEKEIFSHPEESKKLEGEKILRCISRVYELTQGEIFLKDNTADKETRFRLLATYAIHLPEDEPLEFSLGEGLIGQAAQSGKHLYIDKLPEGFLNVKTGLGESNPASFLVIPWKDQKDETYAVIELASFRPFCQHDIELFKSFSENFLTRLLA